MEASRGDLEKALRAEKLIGRIPGGTFTVLVASTALGAVIGYIGYKILHNGKTPRHKLLERIETEQRVSPVARER